MTVPGGRVDGLAAVDHDPFAGSALARVVPTTESQREVWLAASLDPAASLAYNEAITLALDGVLDVGALRTALDALLQRHEALRATFSADGTEMHIAVEAALAITEGDLSMLDDDARGRAVDALLARAVRERFDLEAGPLLRVDLLRLAPTRHLLVVTAHHLVCDGWSFGVIVRELGALYSAASRGAPAGLAAADSIGDFALADIAYRHGEAARDDEAYWLARYADLPPPLELPLDRARPRVRGFASQREDLLLDGALVAALKRAGARQGASLFATLLGGFALFLRRIGASDDLVVGIPAAGQAAAGHGALVGHAVNTLPVRLRIAAGATLGAVLGEVRGQLLDAFEHQRITLGGLLRHLPIARDPSRLPLASVLFNLDSGLDDDSLGFTGLSTRFASVPRSHENFELFLNAVQVQGGLRLECQYAAALFDGATVARWLDLYATLLHSIAAAGADEPFDRLPMLSARAEAELRALQPPVQAREPMRRIESLVFEVAAGAPKREAIRFGERVVGYGELAARARAIATSLRALGAAPGVLVGIMVERSPEMVAAMLGVLASGAAYVPLDPAFPRERLAVMVGDAALGVLLTDRAHAGAVDAPVACTLLLEDVEPSAGDGPPAIAADDGSVAYVIYTSGSTGTPKGVCVPHGAVVNFLSSMRREPGLDEHARLLAVTTLSFDIAVLELLLPLVSGACVVLATRGQAADGRALAALIEAHAVTHLQATPSTWRLLLGAGWAGHKNLVALCGGEALPRDLAEDLLERCATVWNMYGPTETTVWSTCARIEAPVATIPIGRPIDNTVVRVLDANRQACAVGVAGEIAIGGAGVALGYLNRPDLTAERFIADPHAGDPAARLYRTGDRGRWRNDGVLEHFGRLDFQVKLRGFRIELGDVEENLLRHAAVARAVAIVREDRPGDQRLVAYVVPQAGAPVDDAALRMHLRALLPDYMLPQHIVRLAALPLLPNGKLDRAALPPPSPASAAAASSPAHVAPATPLEQRIATAMEAVLSLPGIGLHDNFFALGGHSLLAAQLTTRLGRELGLTLSLGLVFEAPTIAGLASGLSARLAAAGEEAGPIVARGDQASAPLSLLQTRLWLFEELNPGTVVYNTPSAHRLRGALDETAFAAAFDALVQRQAVLRTSIARDGTELVQRVHAHVPIVLFPAEDLSSFDPVQGERELMQRLDALAAEPIALDAVPLFRVRLFRLSATHHVLFFMPHHIIWDGWSFDILYAELGELYAAQRSARAARLPALPVSYGDFSAWHARWLGSAAYRRQFDRQHQRWRERLQADGPVPLLPTDMPRPPKERVGRGDTEWLAIPAVLTDALRGLGRQVDATLFMTLLAVYAVLLWRASGSRRMVVGTPVRVRASADVEPLMGLFTNLLPVPIELRPDERFVDLLGRVKAAVLDALASPDVQLEDLLREPGMRELAGGGRLYQAQFSYQDARARQRDWGGLEQDQVLLFQRAANEDLALWFLEQGNGMTGGVLYDADLFEAATARRLAADYVHLLERAVADPRANVADLSGATGSMAEWVVHDAGTVDERLTARFEAAAVRHPDRIAVRDAMAEASYAQLDRAADRLASRLRRRGVASEALVAIALGAPIACVTALLAVWKAGAVATVIDARLDDAVLAATLASIGADAIVAAAPRALDRTPLTGVWLDEADDDAPTLNRAVDAGADRPALAAGGDRNQAALALSHRDVAAALDDVARRLDIRADDRVAVLADMASPLAVFVALLALRHGATFVGARPGADQARDAEIVFAPRSAAFQADWRGPRARRAIAVGGASFEELVDALSMCAEPSWVAFGEAHGPIPFLVLQAQPRVGDAAGTALPALAPLSIRLCGDNGETVMPGHVGRVEARTPDGLWRRTQAGALRWTASPGPVPLAMRARLLDAGRLQVVTGRAPMRPATIAIAERARAMPDTLAETWLAAQWQDLIGVETVAADDNFFDLGGHSLLAMALLASVEKQTGVRLGLLKLANGSLRAVAAEIPAEAITSGPARPSGLARRMLRLFGIERKDDESA